MIQDHIRDLLSRFQYSEQLKETAVFRILFVQKLTTFFRIGQRSTFSRTIHSAKLVKLCAH